MHRTLSEETWTWTWTSIKVADSVAPANQGLRCGYQPLKICSIIASSGTSLTSGGRFLSAVISWNLKQVLEAEICGWLAAHSRFGMLEPGTIFEGLQVGR